MLWEPGKQWGRLEKLAGLAGTQRVQQANRHILTSLGTEQKKTYLTQEDGRGDTKMLTAILGTQSETSVRQKQNLNTLTSTQEGNIQNQEHKQMPT